MSGRVAKAAFCLVVAALAAPPAPAQGLAVSDEMRAELLGALTYTRLSLRLKEAPAREAFMAVSRAVGVPITGRYIGRRIHYGIDPDAPITLAIDDADGRFVLEMILEQCADYDPCTWQLRNGFIEVGTKERLSAPAAADTRMYPIRDFMLEPPYFVSPASGAAASSVAEFYSHEYSCAAITRPVEVDRREGAARKKPHELAQEIVHAIVETIEPGNWDYGQFVEEADEDDDGRVDFRRARRTSEGRKRIARLRLVDDRVIITAPDFIHRQVNGYPRPTRPRTLTPEELQQRSEEASTERVRIVVLGNAPTGRRSP